MSREEFEKDFDNTEICDQFSWRGILSKKLGTDNYNLSQGGSSNQKQFRLATSFFSSPCFKNLQKDYDQFLVLWGITSTARNEIFSTEKNQRYNFFYKDKNPFSEFFTKHIYNHNYEIQSLKTQMLHWDDFFKNLSIKNHWFDTFNTHDYKKNFFDAEFSAQYKNCSGPKWPLLEDFIQGKIDSTPDYIIEEIKNIFWEKWNLLELENLIGKDDNPRDIASYLAISHGFIGPVNDHHASSWKVDNKKIEFLRDIGILNPISLHPTKLGHRKIADILFEKIHG